MQSRTERQRRLKVAEQNERWIMIAIAVGFIAFIPSIVLGVLLYREIDHRTRENARVIEKVQANEQRQEKSRAEVRQAIRDADIENCQEDEVVKARLRKIVAFDPEELRFTLEQLGIDPDSRRGQGLAERSKAAADEAVYALRPRDCNKLPDPTEPR